VAEALCDEIAIVQAGTIIAQGTMDDLRNQADAGEAHLEEIFLKVTGGEEMADVVAVLKDALG
jgi:ABC-2 type transport system ATP-binding protein